MARSVKTTPARDAEPAAPASGAAEAVGVDKERTDDAALPVDEVPSPAVPKAPEAPAAQAQDRPRPEPRATARRGGFVPGLLGGVVAAGLGLAAVWQGLVPVPGQTATQAALAGQAGRIEDLATAVAALPAAPDVAPLEAGIAELRAAIAPLTERLGTLEQQVAALERLPAGDGSLPASVIEGWQQEIADLKAAMAAQEAEMARVLAASSERLEAAQSTVAGIERQAMETATATLRRAVVANIQTAVDGGLPYANLVSELAATGVEVPQALAVTAASGVGTLQSLQEGFAEAARAALAAARAEGLADDGRSPVVAFLRSQLDLRSVEPREGDDPDAVLSRAEAALGEARLTDALAEIAALPEVVRAPMGGWIAAAESRQSAIAALQALAETLPAPEASN